MMGSGSLVVESMHGDGIAQVSVPAVQGCMFGIAMPALVPRHHPPASRREQRGEDLERAGEVETAVGQEQRRRSLVTPLVDRDAQTGAADLALPGRRVRAGNATGTSTSLMARHPDRPRLADSREPATDAGRAAW